MQTLNKAKPALSENNENSEAVAVKPLKRLSKLGIRLALALLVFGLAFILRFHAAHLLPTDDDEPTYLRSALIYAQHIADGDSSAIINEQDNYEHPPMTKIIFGAIMFADKDYTQVVRRNETSIRDHDQRLFSVIVGSLTAALAALVNPVAGLLVAFNSWHIRYTSETMIEALPCLFAALMLIVLRKSNHKGDWQWWIAAVLLGLTAAGKYIYALVGLTALFWLLNQSAKASLNWRSNWKVNWKWVTGWTGLALLTFYIADPTLWPNPFARLLESLTFSVNYSASPTVFSNHLIWFQPIIWLTTEAPQPVGHLHTFPIPYLNIVVFGLTLLALPWLWKTERLLVWWLASNLIFLLLWPTKWAQYILILTVPMALAVALWLQHLASSYVKPFVQSKFKILLFRS
jgi:hypothetical protein